MKPVRNTILYFLAVCLATAAFWSCDKIDAPYGSVNVSTIDTLQFPAPAFQINTAEPRRILLEDYTGHTCGNCPTAATMLENLIYASDHKIIGVAVHAGETFAAPAPPTYPADYRTEAGEAFDARFGITSAGQPNGMINRRKYNNVYYSIPNTWNSRTNTILNAEPIADVHLSIKSYYDEANDRIIAYVNAGFINPMPGNYKMAAYIIEDSIVGDQKWYGQSLPQNHASEYVFNHMLRGNLSSVWGEDIAAAPQAGSIYRKVWVTRRKTEWNPNHLKVVAVVYDRETYEILQPAEVKLGE